MDPWCEQWGVVTTNYESSEAVCCWMRVEGWCLGIVSDGKSLNNYKTQWTRGKGNIAVVYLSPDDQELQTMLLQMLFLGIVLAISILATCML